MVVGLVCGKYVLSHSSLLINFSYFLFFYHSVIGEWYKLGEIYQYLTMHRHIECLSGIWCWWFTLLYLMYLESSRSFYKFRFMDSFQHLCLYLHTGCSVITFSSQLYSITNVLLTIMSSHYVYEYFCGEI